MGVSSGSAAAGSCVAQRLTSLSLFFGLASELAGARPVRTVSFVVGGALLERLASFCD